jgi:hypothetical protein
MKLPSASNTKSGTRRAAHCELRVSKERNNIGVAGVPLSMPPQARMSDPERHRQKADDCRAASLRARTPDEKAAWLELADEWQKLADAGTPACRR